MYVLLPHFSNFFRTIYLFEVYHCLLSLIIYFSIFLPGFGTICQILFSGIFQARQNGGDFTGGRFAKKQLSRGVSVSILRKPFTGWKQLRILWPEPLPKRARTVKRSNRAIRLLLSGIMEPS
ncbi:hypothetical protein B4098_1441 [Heyndrickxia coagulans]|uniref:Uncharacterized protein n=1 Tax=Heyndrickxia coagulans TaxID=1398 RepID=A0A150KAZ1_HEYCO|nr:hypothetical protein BCO26_2786 [Heyndrickxia coagulans 2-6]KYC66551.1 hypothetical protein B4098_1441 [Heyndrickxia coagulans]